jgi:hypothetical protein
MTYLDVGAEWINTWHNDALKQNNLSYRDDHAIGFCNAMKNKGHHIIFDWGNDNAWESDFRHPNYGGHSLDWIDNVHFAFYSDHGGNWGNVMHIAFSVAHDYGLGASNQWKLGVKKLKWFVLDCCQCVLNTSKEHLSAVWFPPSHGVHMIFGFVGDGHDSWWNASLGSDFGNDIASGNKALGGAWLDRAYSFWLGDTAIAIAFGSTQADAIYRRDHETINARDNNVTPNWMAWKWR